MPFYNSGVQFKKMAGVVPFTSCTPGRKQWNIRDKRSVRRLRSQLAEDGCPESQVVLAKQLLQEKSVIDNTDNEENARLGVFWLIKASEQGNMEATNILKQCLESGEGITEHNYLDVKTCLSTSQNEKLARRAAREMFLSLSAGQDFITSEQLWRRMSKVDSHSLSCTSTVRRRQCELSNGKMDSSCIGNQDQTAETCSDSNDEDDGPSGNTTGWTTSADNYGEKLTEDHLESAASTYSRGELPLVQRVLTLTDPRRRDLEHLNYLQRTLLHPLLTMRGAYAKLLDTLGSRYKNPAWRLFPSFQQLQLLVLLLVLPLLSLENLFLFLSLLVYYVSYLAMVIFTLQTLRSKREYRTFRVWSRLFLSYDRGGNLNTEDAEFEYCKNNMRPFAWFFLSLLVNLMAYPLVSELWVPESELAVIALTLTFVTLATFPEESRRLDLLMLFSFGINVLAKYPYESDGVVRQTWRYLDLELPTLQSYGLPCFASQVVGNGVEFCLNFRGFFYLLIPGIFLKMAHREAWKGTYKALIPHCVTLAWWQVAVLCSQGATLYGLIRSTLAMVGFILFLPLVGLATLILPVVAVLKHLSDAALTPRTGLTTFLAFIPILLGYVLDKRRGVQMGTYLSKVQIFLAVLAGLFLLCPSMNDLMASNTGDADSEMTLPASMTWDQYSSVCHGGTWDKQTTARTQLDCIHLHHLLVNWEGVVQDVGIVRIHNPLTKVLDHVPEVVREKLTCWFGQQYPEDCSEHGTESRQYQLCSTLKQVRRSRCSLSAWDRLDMEMTVLLKSNRWNSAEATVTIAVDDSLRNFTLAVQPGDHVWFAATLAHPDTIGTTKLRVAAEELGCINCLKKSLTSMKRGSDRFSSDSLWRETSSGFKRVLNFLFSPVLVFR